MRRTKIICTIGPACSQPKKLEELILSGMEVARINFSHGTHEEKSREIKQIRQISKKLNRQITILQDLCGPKIRVGEVENKEIYLKEGTTITLTSKPQVSNNKTLFISYPYLAKDLYLKDSILLDDGKLELVVIKKIKDEIVCEVKRGGKLKSKKGVNFPSRSLSIPALTGKDILDVKFGLSEKVDVIALSFVRQADDIIKLCKLIRSLGGDIPIIAKIVKYEAIENLEKILDVCDGIMVARGDLGVEVPIENIPIYQKLIIRKANEHGKPVITATQMLESMIENPTPTRAEVTDISNAILDGTDAIMLSAETSIGKYPVEAVKIMARIAEKTEEIINYPELFKTRKIGSYQMIADAVAHGACQMAYDLSANALITFTSSGHTARLISKYRPHAPIYVFTTNDEVARKVNLYWGTRCFKIKEVKTTDEMFKHALDTAKKEKIIQKNDTVILTAGIPVKEKANTNLIRVVKVN
ncbi:pyruvate kinase [Candidatus Desantisbacteria bacterium]|nr:pyruvate kinase [Candidatus Desantisbacteria bacterium]